MSAALTISRSTTRARLIGTPADAPAVRAALDRLLAGPVADRLAGLAGPDDPDAVICLPRLVVRLHLTRADLEASQSADRWAAAIDQALGQALGQAMDARSGRQVWRFADRQRFHAGYVHFRLGLLAAPQAVFAGFGALDLLSPCRAMAEMLAADPGLWRSLAVPGGPSALAIVQAVIRSGGAEAAGMILSLPPAASAAARSGGWAAAIDMALSGLPDLLARQDRGSVRALQDLALPAQRLLAALLFAPLLPGDPLLLADLAVALLTLIRQGGSTLAVLTRGVLVRLATLEPTLAGPLAALSDRMAQDPRAAADLAALLVMLAPHVVTTGLVRSTPAPVRPDPAAQHRRGSRPADDPPPAAVPLRHFASAFAGVALVLPLLTEDRIGAAFPARVRLAALATLVGSDLFPCPQDSDFLQALTGADDRQDLPDRPAAADLLFVPRAQHAGIMAAPAGADRLAQWLAARFAATLPGLAGSSLTFLQRQFFHHPGEVWIDADQITLRLDPVPLQAVLELAGRLGADLARIDWLGHQSLTIRCDGGPS